MSLVWLVLGTPLWRGPLVHAEEALPWDQLARTDVGAAYAQATAALEALGPEPSRESARVLFAWWDLAEMRLEWNAMDAVLAARRDTWSRLADASDPIERANLHRFQARVAERAGDYQGAARALKAAETQLRSTDAERDLAAVLEEIGQIGLIISEYDKANAALLEASHLFSRRQDTRSVARIWIALSGSSTQSVENRLAGPLEAREVFAGEGDEAWLAYAWLVSAYEAFDDPTSAEHAFDEARRLALKTGNREAFLHARLGLAEVLLFGDRVEEARDLAFGLLEETREAAPKPVRAAVLRVAGYTAAFVADPAAWAEGIARLRESIELFSAIGDGESIQFARLCLGELRLRMGQPEEAETLLRDALEWFAAHESRFLREALALLELAHVEQGHYEEAYHTLASYLEVRESEFASGLARELAELGTEHLAALQQAQLEQLRTAQQLDQAQLSIERQRAARLEAERAQEALQRWAATLGLALTSVAGLVLWILFRRKRRDERHIRQLHGELAMEKAELESKSRQLADRNLEMAEANERLKEIDEERKHLLGIVAHEMRNPLSTMESAYELIEHELNNPHGTPQSEIRDILGVGWEGARFLRSLIDRILAARSNETRAERLRPRPMALRPVLHQVVMLNQLHGTRKGISISLEGGTVPAIQADAQACREVFDNLLSNALKFSPGETQVRIIPRLVAGDRVEVRVEDQGPGIPESEKGRLFKPFGKTSNQPTGGESSTGLGLATVRELVTAMRGSVWIEDVQGGGAAFIVALPVAGSGMLTPGTADRAELGGKKD